MYNERAFIASVEAAGPEDFARIMERPDRDQERALRTYFGDERFARMHELAARRTTVRGEGRRGNVVVIHGIMGGELSVFDRGVGGDRVWLHLLRLINGAFERLRLDERGDGPADARWDVRASGIFKKDYGEQLLRLSQEWNVRAFWYDWRKDLHQAARLLDAQIANWFQPNEPVHIVAHSMGGLVARTFIADHPERWQSMWDAQGNGERGGRLVMLGTPNHGSFAVPQILVGLEGMVRKLAAVDLRHNLAEIREVVHTFVGSYQMLPSPLVLKEVEPLYQAHTYGDDLRIPQRHLDAGRAFHEKLKGVVDAERMVYVAGFNQPTFYAIDGMQVRDRHSYRANYAGDGRVPHQLGLLAGVPTLYVEEVHGSLPGNPDVLDATTTLLRTGRGEGTKLLTDISALLLTRTRELPDGKVPGDDEAEVEEIRRRAEQMQRLRGAEERAPVSEDERVAATLLLDGWVGTHARGRAVPLDAGAPLSGLEAALQAAPTVSTTWTADGEAGGSGGEPTAVPEAGSPGGAAHPSAAAPAGTGRPREVRMRVRKGQIQDDPDDDTTPVDVIAVGHYVGVRPQHAEKALDAAISRVLCGLKSDAEVREDQLVLTQYTERGTIRGELGQPFMLPDPRSPGRLLVIAGMGVPGRFGTPELSVLARELAWMLERLGRKHLATVLIGAGVGNIPTRDAVAAWVRGLQEALAGVADSGGGTSLESITFIEHDPRRVMEIDDTLAEIQARQRSASPGDGSMPFVIDHVPLDTGERETLVEEAVAQATRRVVEEIRADQLDENPSEEPTRITVTLERHDGRSVYRIGAITSGASVPEREIALDEQLVAEVNDRLPGLRDLGEQLHKGRFLEQLLLREMRDALSTTAPVVLVLDATTARIHWEMLAQPGHRGGTGEAPRAADFLSRARKLTRQLRTAFAPIPEPPPPPQRPLRALIVTDPAGDAPLPGASREGFEIADLFERFNRLRGTSPRKVEVRRLNGPGQATRHAVLEELFKESYDILHFAGHCVFDPNNPAASGWIFHDGTRLSANELRRVDRIPKFVFSNACESGITPDRADRRTAALAPSFAEAFFERGVANFVCTAWPVGDEAARIFALHLYAALLGLGSEDKPTDNELRDPVGMQDAMHQAREALLRPVSGATVRDGVQFWGAYQHYGSPSFRFFHASDLERRVPAPQQTAGGSNVPAAEAAPDGG